MMKRLMILLGLIMLVLFVVSCAPKETGEDGALAGQAVKTSSTCTGWGKYCSSLLLGEIEGYRLAGVPYKIELKDILYQNYLGGVHSATFKVNNEEVTLLEGEEKALSDGKFMTVTDFVFQDYAGGVKAVSFCMSG